MHRKTKAAFLSAILLILLGGLFLLLGCILAPEEESAEAAGPVLFLAEKEESDDYAESGGRAVKVGHTVYAITDNYPVPEDGLFRLRSEDTEDHHTEVLLTAEELGAEEAQGLFYFRGSLYFTAGSYTEEGRLEQQLVRYGLANGETEILPKEESALKGSRVKYGRRLVFEEDRLLFYDPYTEQPVGSVSLPHNARYLGADRGKLFFSAGEQILACDAYGTLTAVGKTGQDAYETVPANGKIHVLSDPEPYEGGPSARIDIYDAQTFAKEKEVSVPFECIGWMAVTADGLFLEEEKPDTDHEGPLWRMDLNSGAFICPNENRYYYGGATMLDGQPAEYLTSLNPDRYYDIAPADPASPENRQ